MRRAAIGLWLLGLLSGAAAGPAAALFGPGTTAADVSAGNPLDHAHLRPEVDVLLVHGTADTTVPVFFTERFATALTDGGHDVLVATPDGVDHHTVYSAEEAAPLIIPWLET